MWLEQCNVWCLLTGHHCPLEAYVNRSGQIGVNAQAPGWEGSQGTWPSAIPIAGDANAQDWWSLILLFCY